MLNLQKLQCLSPSIFMQDGSPPLIGSSVILKRLLTKKRTFNRLFPDLGPHRFQYDFWLCRNLKHLVSRVNPRTVHDLNNSISQHAHNISPNEVRLAVERAILRFQMVADNDGRHIEHVLL